MKRIWKIGGGVAAAVAVVGVPLYWLLTYCNHQFSRPFTTKLSAEGQQETYVVCLSCGKEFEFDWKTLRVGKRRGSHGLH